MVQRIGQARPAGVAALASAGVIDVPNPIKTGDCQNDKLEMETETIGASIPGLIKNTVQPRIKTVLPRIRAQAPNAKIILMGYPQLLSTSAWKTVMIDSSACTLGVTKGEVEWIITQIDLMNNQMKATAASAAASFGGSITFADPRPDFADRGACGLPTPWVNDEVLTRTAGDQSILDSPGSAESFHPNPAGATMYAKTFTSALRAVGA